MEHLTASDPPIWYQQKRGLAVNATQESWRPVPGYEGFYEVSDHGTVRSLDRVITVNGVTKHLVGVTLSPFPDSHGYGHVNLYRNGVRDQRGVHKLVALAFIGPRPDGLETCHTNDIHTDNRATNLRYDTHSANGIDTVRAGNHPSTKLTHCPRQHLLTAPNLRATRPEHQGHRRCLACNRTYSWVRNRPHLKDQFDEIADQKYREIMEPLQH